VNCGRVFEGGKVSCYEQITWFQISQYLQNASFRYCYSSSRRRVSSLCKYYNGRYGTKSNSYYSNKRNRGSHDVNVVYYNWYTKDNKWSTNCFCSDSLPSSGQYRLCCCSAYLKLLTFLWVWAGNLRDRRHQRITGTEITLKAYVYSTPELNFFVQESLESYLYTRRIIFPRWPRHTTDYRSEKQFCWILCAACVLEDATTGKHLLRGFDELCKLSLLFEFNELSFAI